MAQISLRYAARSLLLLATLVVLPDKGARAQDALQPGEAFVTRFSGTTSEDGRTIIDTGGTVGSIVDLRGPGAAPRGTHWSDEPQRSAVTAGQVGQVFGIALDDASPPNVYLTATSAFGLHRNADNRGWMAGMWGPDAGPGTVWKLDAGNHYRPEIFARITLEGRGNSAAALGNIAYDRWNKQLYVSDLETGMIHRLRVSDGSDLGHYDHGTQGRPSFVDAHSGAPQSLPSVAFDTESGARLSDCPTGDFARTPSCWNLADFRRRVWGVGVRRDAAGEVRLYYSVWNSQGFGSPDYAGAGDDQRNAVWSVGIGSDGAFDTSSVRREFFLPDFFRSPEAIGRAGLSHPVTDIAFPSSSDQPVMVLAERGGVRNLGLAAENAFATPNEARVLRYQRNEQGVWEPVGRYDIGIYDRKNEGTPYIRANASGGAAFGLGYTGDWEIDPDRLNAFLWMTGDGLCTPDGPCRNPDAGTRTDESQVHGLMGEAQSAYQEIVPEAAFQPYPAPGPATPSDGPDHAYMIDIDVDGDSARNDATRMGDVAIFEPPPAAEVAEGPEEPAIEPGPGEEEVPGGEVVEEEEEVVIDGGGPHDGGPDHGEEDHGPIPEGGDEGVAGWDFGVVKQAPDFCQPGIECFFTILITNNSGMDYEGPLLLDDELASGADRATFTTVDGAGWACFGEGDSRVCRNDNIAIPAHETVTFRVGYDISEGGSFALENCAQFNWPLSPPADSGMDDETWRNLVVEQTLLAQGRMEVADGIDGTIDDATTEAIRQYQHDNGLDETGEIDAALLEHMFPGVTRRGDDESGNDSSCGTAAVIGDDVEHINPDLVIEKSGPASCTVGDECKYQVTVTNDGPGAFNGVISLTDLPTGIDAADFDHWETAGLGPTWHCEEVGDRIECETTTDVTLEEDESVSVNLYFNVPAAVPGESIDNCCWLTDGEPTVEEGMLWPLGPRRSYAQSHAPKNYSVWRRSSLVRKAAFGAANTRSDDDARKTLAQAQLSRRPLRDRNMKNNRSCISTPIVHRAGPPPRLTCGPGWKAYKRRSDIPRGSQRRRLVRGKQVLWCARPIKPITCWSAAWRKVSPGFERKGWTVRTRRSGNQVIWCAREEVRERCPKGIRCEGGTLRRNTCICDRSGRPRRVQIDQCTFACKPPICPKERLLRNGQCCPAGQTAGANGTRCVSGEAPGGTAVQCVGGKLVRGNCVCPPNTIRTTPAANVVACKPKPISCIGGNVVDGRCTCGANMSVKRESENTYRCVRTGPEKTCPPGTVGVYPNCKKKPCPPGTAGTYPNCKKMVCPSGTVGTYPNCRKKVCPPGTVGTYPNCKKRRCPPGTVGTYPNCKKKRCPPGTVGTYPNCKKKAAPKTKTIKKHIVRRCPRGMKRVGGKCVKAR